MPSPLPLFFFIHQNVEAFHDCLDNLNCSFFITVFLFSLYFWVLFSLFCFHIKFAFYIQAPSTLLFGYPYFPLKWFVCLNLFKNLLIFPHSHSLSFSLFLFIVASPPSFSRGTGLLMALLQFDSLMELTVDDFPHHQHLATETPCRSHPHGSPQVRKYHAMSHADKW